MTVIDDARRAQDETSLEDQVRDMLPASKYHDIKMISGGDGTRRAKFRGNWVLNGHSRPVRIKVDKKVTDPRSQAMREKGYDTTNDATFLSQLPCDEATTNGVSPILDFEQKNGLIVSVEPEFNGTSLAEFFKDRQPTKEEFNQVLAGVTRAVQYVHDRGYYHRDLTDRNIMARRNGSGIETRLTDFEFSVPKERTDDTPFTTTGTRSLRDPLLSTQPYGDQSEIYQIAMNAVNLFRSEPLQLYNENGVDHDEHNKKVKKAILQLPKSIRKNHGKWIERALTVNSEERFAKFSDFVQAVDRARAPSMWERVKRNAKTIGTVAGITGALAVGAGGMLYGHAQKMYAEQIAEASIPRVETRWNGRGMEMFNDQIKLEVNLSGYNGEKKPENHQWYPHRNQFLRVEPGQELSFVAEISADIQRDETNSTAFVPFNGRFYIEGERFDDGSVVQEFIVNSENSDVAKRDYDMGYWNPSNKDFKLPSDMKEGVYIFAAEVFAPSEKERTKPYRWEEENSREVNNWAEAKIRFNHPDKAIARKRIPLVVGSPELAAEVYNLGFNWYKEDWDARKVNENISGYGYSIAPESAAHFFAEMPGTEYERYLSEGYRYLGLPNSEREGEGRDLIFHIRDSQGKIIGFTGVPVETRKVFPQSSVDEGHVKQQYEWDFGEVDKGFAGRLVAYRESLPYQTEVPKQEEKK